MLTQERLKKVLKYNKKTGLFTWRQRVGRRIAAGSIAGTKRKDGYIYMHVDGVSCMAHRFAFLYVDGYIPENDVDHINGIKNDNSWNNLRHVSRMCNMQNQNINSKNTSGFMGVTFCKNAQKWISQIIVEKKRIYLGVHCDKVSAALARVLFEDQCDKWKCDARQINRIKLRTMGYKV